MSVYTPISNDTFSQLLSCFGLTFQSADPISHGIQNSNWFITVAGGQHDSYVFTLFETRPPADVAIMAKLLNQLKTHLPVAAPLPVCQPLDPNVDGEYFVMHEGKATCLAPCLTGGHPDTITAPMCHEMGRQLAILHQSLAMLSPAEEYAVAQYPWDEVRRCEYVQMPLEHQQLLDTVWQAYYATDLSDLPHGLIHADLFVDNTLWQDATCMGILDFAEVSLDYYLMDIAITANDFCTDWETVTFSSTYFADFLSGYESVRPLTLAEQTHIRLMLAMAAIRFWLLRLNVFRGNQTLGRTGEDISTKDPTAMCRLAAYHLSCGTFS